MFVLYQKYRTFLVGMALSARTAYRNETFGAKVVNLEAPRRNNMVDEK